jgi:Arc/MetJ-type ribon-helix-helix transcriptional regulator
MSTENIEPELTSLRTKLAVEIENDQKEIEIRKRRIEKNTALLHAVRGSLSTLHLDSTTAGYGSKAEMIRDAIRRLPNQRFTQDDVEAEIKRSNPEIELNRNRIRAAIWTLCNKHKTIKLITKGSRRKPAEFERSEGITRIRRTTEQDREQTLRNADLGLPGGNGSGKMQPQVSTSALEDAVRSKNGRIEHLANRLNTDESTIRTLLEPASKVYVSVGGWLKLRE